MMPTNNREQSHKFRSQNPTWQPAVVLIFAQMVNGIRDMPQSAFFLIYLQEKLSLAPFAISSVVSGAQLVGMAAALLGGGLANKLGSKWVFFLGLILSGISSLVFQVQAFWVVMLLWFIGGGGIALVTVGGASYLTRLSSGGALGILAALYALSLTAGGAIGNPIAGFLIERYGFGTFGWAAIGITIITALIVAFRMVNLHDKTARSDLGENSTGGILAVIRSKKVQILIGLRGLPTLFYGMLTVLIPLMINDLSNSKVTVAAYGTTSLIVASAAQLLAGKAADRWGAFRPTLIAYSILILTGLALFLGAGSLLATFAFGVLGISAAWSLSTLMYVWVSDGIPKEEHPPTFGLLHAVWSLCMIGGAMLGGWLVRFTPGLPFLVLGLSITAACFLASAYYRNKTNQDEACITQSP
jgi:MFS family permease